MSAPGPGKRDVLISKALSYLLRHGANKEKLEIDDRGFIKVSDILKNNRIRTYKTTVEDVERIVNNNDKKRFNIETRENEKYICANQGHSISSVSESNLEIITLDNLPKDVYHGTYKSRLPEIVKSGGLHRMKRNHIHFTSSENNLSGIRRSANVLIYIDIAKCLNDGMIFYMSDNKVILSSGIEGVIPLQYFSQVIDCKTNENIDIKIYLTSS